MTDQNAIATNPVKGVNARRSDSYEGQDAGDRRQGGRQLMNLPNDKSLKASGPCPARNAAVSRAPRESSAN